MKGIFFCALIELKRRIPDFIAFGIIIALYAERKRHNYYYRDA